MDNEKPFDKLLEKIGYLLEKIQKGQLKPNAELPKDLEAKLAELEKNIELFCRTNANVMTKAQVNDREIQQVLKKPEENKRLPLKEKRLLEKVARLKSDAEEFSRNVTLKKKQLEKKQRDQGKGNFGRQRKKKFKSLGGQDWIPL